jgi:hypothetical protein
MATMFLYQYTMCNMKCTTGELRACCIVLKTQYSFETTIFARILCEVFYLNSYTCRIKDRSYTLQYIMVPTCLVFTQR